MKTEAVTNPSAKKEIWSDKMSKNRCAGRLFGTRAFGMGLCLEQGKDGGSVAHMKTRGLQCDNCSRCEISTTSKRVLLSLCSYHCWSTNQHRVCCRSPFTTVTFDLFQMVFSYNSLMMLNTPCVNLILF